MIACSSDKEYAEIVSTYLNSFEEGHLFLKTNVGDRFDRPKPEEITPLFVKRVDGHYVVSATNNESIKGQEITTINGMPIEQYLISKGFQQDVEMQIMDKDGKPYNPEFHINDDNCEVSLSNGTVIQIDNIPVAEAIRLKETIQIAEQPNIICGYTEDGLPYVRINSLDKNKKEQAKEQLAAFAEQIKGQTDLVIDIRGNKGGSDEYIEYLGAFSDGTYTDEHEYEQLVGISERETNANINDKQIEDIDSTLKRIDNTRNREVDSHVSVIPDGKSTITNRLLLVDGQVFSSADKMAKTVQDSGFATVVGSELTKGDGKGVSIHQVDTPILREQGLSITMPSSMGLDYSEFQTTPDIMTSEHEINTNLGKIMEQSKKLKKNEVVEWTEIKSPQQEIQQSVIEQSYDIVNTFVEASSLQANSIHSLGNVGQNTIGGIGNGTPSAPSNSVSSMSSSGHSK